MCPLSLAILHLAQNLSSTLAEETPAGGESSQARRDCPAGPSKLSCPPLLPLGGNERRNRIDRRHRLTRETSSQALLQSIAERLPLLLAPAACEGDCQGGHEGGAKESGEVSSQDLLVAVPFEVDPGRMRQRVDRA